MRKFKSSSTTILKIIMALIALGAFGFLAAVIPSETDFNNLGIYIYFLILIYISALPFFYVVYQIIHLLNIIDKNTGFSESSISVLRRIKLGSSIFSFLYVVFMPYIFYIAKMEDAPGIALIGFVMIFGSAVVATFAAVLQKLIQDGVNIKSENDLTV